MEGVQKWELRERDIRLLYFVVGSSILLEFFAVETPVVLIVHRAGAAARLRPAWCLERGD